MFLLEKCLQGEWIHLPFFQWKTAFLSSCLPSEGSTLTEKKLFLWSKVSLDSIYTYWLGKQKCVWQSYVSFECINSLFNMLLSDKFHKGNRYMHAHIELTLSLKYMLHLWWGLPFGKQICLHREQQLPWLSSREHCLLIPGSLIAVCLRHTWAIYEHIAFSYWWRSDSLPHVLWFADLLLFVKGRPHLRRSLIHAVSLPFHVPAVFSI